MRGWGTWQRWLGHVYLHGGQHSSPRSLSMHRPLANLLTHRAVFWKHKSDHVTLLFKTFPLHLDTWKFELLWCLQFMPHYLQRREFGEGNRFGQHSPRHWRNKKTANWILSVFNLAALSKHRMYLEAWVIWSRCRLLRNGISKIIQLNSLTLQMKKLGHREGKWHLKRLPGVNQNSCPLTPGPVTDWWTALQIEGCLRLVGKSGRARQMGGSGGGSL